MISILGLLIGLLFSVITKTKNHAVQLVPFAILIFLILSGDLIPIGDMPSLLRLIAGNSPITIANEALRSVMLEGDSVKRFLAKVIRS